MLAWRWISPDTMHPPVPADRQIGEELAPFGNSLTAEQISKIRQYSELLGRWNKSVSLTSITDPYEIIRRHFGESLFLASLLPVENCRLADVGTGAGFPGLALKIGHPSIELTLIEPNRKKTAFLAEVVRVLNLEGVEIRPERFEGIRPEMIQADVVTSRAVGGYRKLLRWSSVALAEQGHVALWVGGEDATRIAGAANWVWQPAVRIPESQRRFVLIGRRISESSGPR